MLFFFSIERLGILEWKCVKSRKFFFLFELHETLEKSYLTEKLNVPEE